MSEQTRPLTEDERTQAARIADRLLDEPYADPDDDIRVLARQFNRSQEEVERRNRELFRLQAALTFIREESIPQGMSPAFFAERVLLGETPHD